MKAKLALLIAIALGFLAAFAVREYVRDKETRIYAGEKPVTVLVAARDILEGEAITGAALDRKQYPRRFLPPDAITSSESVNIIGSKVTAKIKKGDALQWKSLLERQKELELGLQSRLNVGERAMTMSVNNVAGVGGMIRPGDRIDLYGTFTVPDDDAPGGSVRRTKTVMRSVLVLATDTRMSSVEAASAARRRKGKKGGYSTLTLQLTPQEVNVLLCADEMGKLTAALRNREDIIDMEEPKDVDSQTFWEILEEVERERDRRLQEVLDSGRPSGMTDIDEDETP